MSETLIERPTSLEEALEVLGAPGAAPLAGATWLMRAPIRGEPWAAAYVALGGIAKLHEIETGALTRFGACVSHAELARATAGHPWLHALHGAAASSANPAVRRVATLGGNLCAAGFAAADLVPALLVLDAELTMRGAGGQRQIPLAQFLAERSTADRPELLSLVTLARREVLSGHARLPLRVGGGDYPVAIVSVALARDNGGLIQAAAVAVGSVEPLARRWPELEAALVGGPVDPDAAAAAAEALSATWSGRDDIDAPGWYRVRVLPALVRRAVGDAVAGSQVP